MCCRNSICHTHTPSDSRHHAKSLSEARTRSHQSQVLPEQCVPLLRFHAFDPIVIDISDINFQEVLLYVSCRSSMRGTHADTRPQHADQNSMSCVTSMSFQASTQYVSYPDSGRLQAALSAMAPQKQAGKAAAKLQGRELQRNTQAQPKAAYCTL